MEFSNLVEAIQEDKTAELNSQFKKLTPRLIAFLQVHMDAEKKDAEDCAQEALLKSIETIREENINNANHILSFLLTTCRNNYLNLMQKKNPHRFEDIPRHFGHKPRQLLTLLDKERRRILEWCMQQLSKSYKTFMEYWFAYPDSDARAVANHFDISVNNAWTRKHRIMKKLSQCCQEKSEY
jgi:RNA polymerase sigma factor (sigma-70 family)